MSDGLISRKNLMERVLQEEYDNDIHKDGRAKAIHHGEYQHFYKTIVKTPTAYDVDKVIEQLENSKTNFIGMGTLQSAYFDKGIDKAIEIVKSGGVSDD